MSATLKLGLHEPFDGGEAGSHVVADIVPIDRGGAALRGQAIPAGGAGQTREISVAPGRYFVQATLPSGSIVSDQVEIAEGETKALLLEAGDEPDEPPPAPALRLHAFAVPKFACKRSAAPPPRSPAARHLGSAPPPPPPPPPPAPPCLHVLAVEPGAWDWGKLAALAGQERVLVEDVVAALGAREVARLSPTHVDEGAQSFHLDGAPFAALDVAPPHPAPRYFAALRRRSGVDLVALPLPWPSGGAGGRAIVDLAVPAADGDPPSTVVREPRFGPVIAYLASGSPVAARQVLDQTVTDLLAEKNPYAALAGACVLVESEVGATAEPWHPWIEDLAKLFPWLPDGAALAGFRLLRHAASKDDVARARQWLAEAVRRGIPCYASALGRLLDGLTILVDDPDIDAGGLAGALPGVRRVSLTTITRQPFSTMHIGGGS